MEFAAGILVGIISAILTYFTLKAQLRQTNRRVHYVRYISPLLMSRDDATQNAVELELYGEPLISPYVYVVNIENPGSAPIVPSAFDSPIAIRLGAC